MQPAGAASAWSRLILKHPAARVLSRMASHTQSHGCTHTAATRAGARPLVATHLGLRLRHARHLLIYAAHRLAHLVDVARHATQVLRSGQHVLSKDHPACLHEPRQHKHFWPQIPQATSPTGNTTYNVHPSSTTACTPRPTWVMVSALASMLSVVALMSATSACSAAICLPSCTVLTP